MLRVVTVIGHGASTYGANFLPHFLNHYKFADEICIAAYVSDICPNIVDEISSQIQPFRNTRIIRVEHGQTFDWNRVTELYNEVKLTFPDDWWIVADIDEFHVYSLGDPRRIVEHCDRNGWEIVRGGFIDRIGIDGTFPVLTSDKGIFQQFPMMGFFRYPLSKACPNKICIMKGRVELTAGQHYALIDGHTTWRWQGWNHPLIAPYEQYSVQVHHFKWDSTCSERLLAVANSNHEKSFSSEYQIMYDALKETDFKVDVNYKDFMFEMSETTDCVYTTYKQWNKLIKKIISI